MAIDYEKLENSAKKLIRNAGQAMELSRKVGGNVNMATGATTSAKVLQKWDITGVILNYRNSEIDGEAILASDRKAIIHAVETEPRPGWELRVKNKDYQIIAVESIEPAGVVVIYKLQVRL